MDRLARSDRRMLGEHKLLAVRVLVLTGLVLGLLPFTASPALAARALTASVDRTLSYRGQTPTYTFTVNNTSTAAEPVASVVITRPSDVWTVTACPQPPTGWTGTVNAGWCLYNSAAGSADDIAAGSSKTFKVTASVAAGSASVTGTNWTIYGDTSDTFSTLDGYTLATASSAGALSASVYGIEVTDVIVGTGAPVIGSSCPASQKKAPAGSTRVLTVCGRVHASTSFSAKSQNSSLTGTFVANGGVVSSGTVPSGGGQVVLANFATVGVTAAAAPGLTVIAEVGTANDSLSSPLVTLGGYTTDVTAPPVPGPPDLEASSDTGVSSSDDVTSDSTPTFTGSTEADAAVEILVGTATKATATADGSGAYSATVSVDASLSDGTKSITVRSTDGSGNVSATSSALSITVDSSAPLSPSITNNPGNTGTGTSPAWSFSGESNATFKCQVTFPDASTVSDNSCVSPKTFDLNGGEDGTYTFTVSQKDPAGNQSTNATHEYALDRTAPAAPSITARPADQVSNPAVSWSFTGEPGGTYDCVLVRPDLSEVKDATCDSPKAYNLSTQPDGHYTFKVRQTDVLGHTGPYASDTFEIDRESPGAPSITAGPEARSNDGTPQWSFTGEPGGSFECVLVKPGNVEVTNANCSSPMGYDIAAATDGSYTFKVRQSDALGNAGAFATSTYVLDRQAPGAPSISSRPANFDDDDSPEWIFEGEPDATYECVLVKPDSGEVNDDTCTSPKTFVLTNESDGLYTFKVRQVDAAGNPSPYETDNFTIDRVPPPAPTLSGKPAEVVSDPSVEWTFTGESLATFECILVMPDLSEISDNSCASPKSYDLTTGEDGLYTFKVRQLDLAGQPGAYVTDTFELDRVPPGTPTIDSAPEARSNDDTPEWSFSGEYGTTFECILVKPDNVQVTTSDCASPRSYDLSNGVDGTYTFKVRQLDGVGNPTAYATSSYILDRQDPSVPSITSRPPNYDDDPEPTWAFSGEGGATFECALVRPDLTEIAEIPCSSPKTFDLTSELDGSYSFKVRQVDAAGNEGGYEVDEFTLDRTPPRPGLTGGAPDVTNVSIHEWAFTGIPVAVFECTLIAPDLTETVDPGCTSPYSIDFMSLPDGTYTFSVRQFQDEDGSVPETDTFTLDRAASAPSLSVQPGDVGNDPTPSWSFAGESGATFECVLVDPGGAEEVNGDCQTPAQYNLDSRTDGDYTLKVRQTDPAGNVSGYATQKYELDRQAADAPTLVSKPKKRTRDMTPAWSFTGEIGATFNCALTGPDGTVTMDEDCSSPKAYVLQKVQGRYTFSVTQVDPAGNESLPRIHRMKLDLTKPVVKSLRIKPKRFIASPKTFVGIRFGRSEPSEARVIIKKGRKILKVFKKPMGRTAVSLRWKTVYRNKVIAPGKYQVLVKLKDKVGLRSAVKTTITARR